MSDLLILVLLGVCREYFPHKHVLDAVVVLELVAVYVDWNNLRSSVKEIEHGTREQPKRKANSSLMAPTVVVVSVLWLGLFLCRRTIILERDCKKEFLAWILVVCGCFLLL